MDDQLIACIFQCYAANSIILFTKRVQLHEAYDSKMDAQRSFLSGFGFFLAACTPHRFLAATLCFDHDRQIQTTEGA